MATDPTRLNRARVMQLVLKLNEERNIMEGFACVRKGGLSNILTAKDTDAKSYQYHQLTVDGLIGEIKAELAKP